MARIRSTHPGQWTDESFATLSPLAHLLAIGLRNEADDGGAFEWRPVQLKVRLLPLYECDAAALLDEIERNEIVRSYDAGGKRYGAIRNFCRYQSPDKPREIYPRPDWIDGYVGKKPRAADPAPPTPTLPNGHDEPTGSRPVADKSPTATPRKGREGKGEEGKVTAPAGAYRWRGSIIRLNEGHYDGWKRSYHAIDLDAQLQQLDDFLAGDSATDRQRKDWFNVVSGSLRKRHEAALAAAEKAKPRPDPSDPASHLSAWERTQLKQRAEEQVRAEGESPHTTEGMARVNRLVLESASAQRRTA